MGSDSYGSYPYLRWRPMRKETSKAVFTGEATEPVTLIFYHGSAAYPVAAQIKIKNVGGRYRGDIEADIPAALSGVTRSSIEVAGCTRCYECQCYDGEGYGLGSPCCP